MRIFTRYRDVKIGLHMFGKRIKHMGHHIAWQITNMAFGEISLEIEVKPATKIKCHLPRRHRANEFTIKRVYRQDINSHYTHQRLRFTVIGGVFEHQ